MKKLSFIILTAVLIGCSAKERKTDNFDHPQKDSIEKYVYIDRGSILHISKNCKAVYKEKNALSVQPVELDVISYESLKSICSVCVTEKQIEYMDSIFTANRSTYVYIGELYNRLKGRYSDVNDEVIFRRDLKVRIKLENLYNDIRDIDIVPNTYDQFLEKIGYIK